MEIIHIIIFDICAILLQNVYENSCFVSLQETAQTLIR